MFDNQYHIFPSLLIPHNVGYLDLYLDIEGVWHVYSSMAIGTDHHGV